MAFVLSAQGLACHCVSGQPLGLTHTGARGCSGAQTRHRSLASCAHKYICQWGSARKRGRGGLHWGGLADSLHSATAVTVTSHIQSRSFGYFYLFPAVILIPLCGLGVIKTSCVVGFLIIYISGYPFISFVSIQGQPVRNSILYMFVFCDINPLRCEVRVLTSFQQWRLTLGCTPSQYLSQMLNFNAFCLAFPSSVLMN